MENIRHPKIKLNPYTQAISNCLQQFEEGQGVPQLDDATSQFLANMIQGRFIHYLVKRLCDHYQITDSELRKQLIMVMMSILTDKFFSVFREKVTANKDIVYKIALRITRIELLDGGNIKKTDALYRWISRRYFEYQNFRIILKWINTNPEIEKIVFLSHIHQRIKNTALIKALRYILKNDKDGIAALIFQRYVKKNRIDRLSNLVSTGDWKIEAEFVQKEYSRSIAWRDYMNNI